jgi:hypothetical protein
MFSSSSSSWSPVCYWVPPERMTAPVIEGHADLVRGFEQVTRAYPDRSADNRQLVIFE